MNDTHARYVTPLYLRGGQLYGILIDPELWAKVQDSITPILDKALEQMHPTQPRPEPMHDWENLLDYWDFKYPVCADVHCDHCGAVSEDWCNDEPRRFRLKAANIGGLATFECLSCGARVIKRHFKDHMNFECRPVSTDD